ncbi:uncharacterized protein EV154DRAFT_585697 [Mucor mucedo]|uniref:uncharacterized protein n=1 Tax=Mucor mucedo TaxID=29922 RepID=UPI0022201515|nr:uncharacterized protein EV154DRAFT_585697 [Mucor mucedo]KAI7864297.1 hypothetical protein EV154DRAFT_585697 [Mucor mucedo]
MLIHGVKNRTYAKIHSSIGGHDQYTGKNPSKIREIYSEISIKVYVFYSLPSASGLAFRHELKIKRAQRRMSDDRCQNKSREHRNYRSYVTTTCTLAVPKDSAVFQNLFIVTEGDQEHNWDNKSKEVFFMKESTLFLNGQRLKSFESSEMSIASILPGRISTSVKGGRRLWREQGITQYSSQLCWLIECLNTCGHLGLKKRTEIDRPSRLYTGTQDTTKVTRKTSEIIDSEARITGVLEAGITIEARPDCSNVANDKSDRLRL